MLGMMNCPTENLDFYASPPTAARQLPATASEQQQQPDDGAMATANGLEVFSARKHRPQISYTDGRRMVDGKLEEGDVREPGQMWSRAIVDSFVERQLRHTTDDGEEAGDRKPESEGEEAEKDQTKEKTRPIKKRSFSFSALLPNKLKKSSRKSSCAQSSRNQQQQKS